MTTLGPGGRTSYRAGFTPLTQVRLTNVAYLRMYKCGHRFEIACYRNKVLNWRAKIETDIAEVLQIEAIFSNVSKGNLANTKDLMQAFGTTDVLTICKEILSKGELQVSEQERSAQYDIMFKDIAAIVSEKSVNPENNRPYTAQIIQNAMKQIHFSVGINKSAKKQALDVINKLKTVMPIIRVSMLVSVIVPNEVVPAIEIFLFSSSGVGANGGVQLVKQGSYSSSTVQENSTGAGGDDDGKATQSGMHFWNLRINPDHYKKIMNHVAEQAGGKGRVEILKLKDMDSDSIAAPEVKNAVTSADSNEDEMHQRGDDIESDDSVVEKTADVATECRDSSDSESEEDMEEVVDRLMREMQASKMKDKAEQGKAKQSSKGAKKGKKGGKAAAENTPAAPVCRSDVLPPAPPTPAVTAPIATEAAINTGGPVAAKTGLSCTTCGGNFEDSAAHRQHFKSEWHRFNLKQKMLISSAKSNGAETSARILSEEEFIALTMR